jgi:lipopolysaccharide export system permease protein
MLVGILFLLAINNIVIYLKEHMMSGEMPIFPGLFWVPLLILVVAMYTFLRRSRDLPILPAWPGARAS